MGAAPTRRLSMEDLRPESFEQIVGQEAALQRLQRIATAVREGRLLPPHLLFHGPPGVGKTTAARAYARSILGEAYEHSFHQLGSADDRSLDTIRDRVVPQTRTAPSRGAPFRIFFLDEADTLDAEEQAALRPALEGGDGRTAMVLACNRIEAIDEPLRSRATVLEFGVLDPGGIRRIVAEAIVRVGLPLDRAATESIASQCHGSAREAMRLLLEEAALAPAAPVGVPAGF